MPVSTLPIAAVIPGNVLTSTNWNAIVKDNLNKLLNTGHRVLTVAQFGALAAPEGTKGTVAPDEVYLEVDATNGIEWHLAFESGEPTYKWRFLGGPALYAFVAAADSTTSNAYAALANAGPTITLPRAGDFDITIGALISESGSSFGVMSYDIGGTGAVDADSVQAGNASTVGVGASVSRFNRKTGLTAVALTSKYKSSVNLAQVIFASRFMCVTPARLI